jgi:hypothetical protein
MNKRGDRHLRGVFTAGASANARSANPYADAATHEGRAYRANKIARIASATMALGVDLVLLLSADGEMVDDLTLTTATTTHSGRFSSIVQPSVPAY